MPRHANISDENIVQMYQQGATYKEMVAYSGLSDRAIRNVIYKYNIETRPVGQPRKHRLNEHFFKTWSPEMAWVLGLLLTDGHISKDTSSIAFSQKDERILRQVAELMEADYVLAAMGKTKQTPTLLMNSKEMQQDLLKLAITPKKSLTVAFPPVPEAFMPDFVRGVIDGDGSVDQNGYRINVTTASKAFAEALLGLFRKWSLKAKISSYFSENNTEIFRVWVIGKESVIQLATIIYPDCEDLCVFSKKERMIQWTDPVAREKILHEKNIMRTDYKTRISKILLDQLKLLAIETNTPIGYLLESGYRHLLNEPELRLQKQIRPTDRVEFRTTCETAILNQLKAFAKEQNLNLNEVIEASIAYI